MISVPLFESISFHEWSRFHLICHFYCDLTSLPAPLFSLNNINAKSWISNAIYIYISCSNPEWFQNSAVRAAQWWTNCRIISGKEHKQHPMSPRTGLFSATVSGPFCEWPLCFLPSFSYRILNFEDFINATDAMTQILDEETKPINMRKNLNQRIKARRNVKDSEWGKQRKRDWKGGK